MKSHDPNAILKEMRQLGAAHNVPTTDLAAVLLIAELRQLNEYLDHLHALTANALSARHGELEPLA